MTEKLKEVIMEENSILKKHPRLSLFSNLLENKFVIKKRDGTLIKSSNTLLFAIKEHEERLDPARKDLVYDATICGNIFVLGKTGSGKTTLIQSYLYKGFFGGLGHVFWASPEKL